MRKRSVFLSHSSRDKPLVRRIDRRLRDHGFATFLDEAELEAGDDLPARFRKAIGAASHVAVVWTPHAAASLWVARELKFATSRLFRRPLVVPLLFTAPGNDPVIHNIKGVDFSDSFGFEASFAHLVRFIGADPSRRCSPPEADFHAFLEETPAIAPVFSAGRPEDLTTLTLPGLGEPAFHALDYAMWSAAQRAGSLEAFVRYPGIFARTFGRTGAGYEALRLLADRNDVTDKIFGELIDPVQVDESMLDPVIALAERNPQPPHGWAWRFADRQRARLSPKQRQRLFRLVETWGDGPSPGGPVDLLGELIHSHDMREAVLDKMTAWLQRGLFDGAGGQPLAESPYLYFGFIAGLDRRGMPQEAERLCDAAGARIRRLFRSATDASVMTALRWVSGADRLPLNPRPYAHAVQNAAGEGVYSVEFESWEHARTVSPLAGQLARALLEPHEALRRQEMDSARSAVRAGLAPLGLETVMV